MSICEINSAVHLHFLRRLQRVGGEEGFTDIIKIGKSDSFGIFDISHDQVYEVLVKRIKDVVAG